MSHCHCFSTLFAVELFGVHFSAFRLHSLISVSIRSCAFFEGHSYRVYVSHLYDTTNIFGQIVYRLVCCSQTPYHTVNFPIALTAFAQVSVFSFFLYFSPFHSNSKHTNARSSTFTHENKHRVFTMVFYFAWLFLLFRVFLGWYNSKCSSHTHKQINKQFL